MSTHPRCALAAIVAAATLALGLPASSLAQQTDHFTCYKAKTTSGTPKFVAIPGVGLVDQFRSSTVEVKKPKLFCAPTNKNGEDPTAPAHPDHLEDYLIKPTVKFIALSNQKVVDQFGTYFYDVKKPVALQVPTAKSLSMPFPPDPADPAVDHFTCYKVRTTKNTAKFVRQNGVTIQDQFGAMTVDVLKARRLCLPTNKNNEEPGAEDHAEHLMCYKIKQTSVPKFVTVSPLFVGNQLGEETLDARKPAELCVPALKNPPVVTPTPTPAHTATVTPTVQATPGCGNGIVDIGEQCDSTAPPGGLAVCHPSQCVPPHAQPSSFACTCATGQVRTLFQPSADLDNGWTGISHNAQTTVPSDADLLTYDCDGVLDPECRVIGPRAGKYGYRCELNPRIQCDANADCAPLNGRCGAFLGPPLPLSSGGVPVCVTSFFDKPITGTLNVTTGSAESNSFLFSRVHLSTAVAAPCPRCICNTPLCMNQIGDTGTCNGGSSHLQPCTIQATSQFGPMSHDCPPDNAANVSGANGLDVRFAPSTTGTSSKSATLPCTAPAFAGYLCPCDTCAGGDYVANSPCDENADCPGGGVCGAMRCLGGTNDGAICTTPSECPPGAPVSSCGRPGILTQPNQCELGCQMTAVPCGTNADCGADGPCVPLCAQIPGEQTGMGTCAVGPVDTKCSVDDFVGCNVDAQCNAPSCIPPGTCTNCTTCGQTCVTEPRPCHVFPINLQGTAGAFLLNDSTGETVTAFCIPPTSSPAVNSTAGLPGEGTIVAPHLYQKKFPPDTCGLTCP